MIYTIDISCCVRIIELTGGRVQFVAYLLHGSNSLRGSNLLCGSVCYEVDFGYHSISTIHLVGDNRKFETLQTWGSSFQRIIERLPFNIFC